MLIRALILAMMALQGLWHLWWAPPQFLAPWLGATLMTLPILPAGLLSLVGRPSAGFWAGVAALFYFSHGVMEIWAAPDARAPAILQVLLAVAMVFASSWRGLEARLGGRREG